MKYSDPEHASRPENASEGETAASLASPENASGDRARARRDWILVGLTIVLGWGAFQYRGALPTSGDRRTVTVTVIPSDQRELECASEKEFQGLRCDGSSGDVGAARPRVRPQERLAPYVSIERELIVLSGLFSYDSVQKEAKKRRRGPPKDRRFSVECSVELVERVEGLPIRFGRKNPFKASEPAWIARTLRCDPK